MVRRLQMIPMIRLQAIKKRNVCGSVAAARGGSGWRRIMYSPRRKVQAYPLRRFPHTHVEVAQPLVELARQLGRLLESGKLLVFAPLLAATSTASCAALC